MAFQVSPGVQVKEIDATSVIPAVSTSIGGFVGAFNWGPVEEIRLVSSEDNMASIFSAPDTTTAKYFLTAASFLKYGNALKVVRTIDKTESGANTASVVGGDSTLVLNDTNYETQSFTIATHGEWIARYPGKLGNSLRVEICSNAQAYSGWEHAGEFDGAPGTSQYALNLGYDGVTTTGGSQSSGSSAGNSYIEEADATATGTGTTTLNLEADANYSVAVGYEVTGVGIPADTTVVTKVSATEFVLSAAHTVAVDAQITFTAPATAGTIKPLTKDELHVLVIDEDGHFTGTPGAILERWPFLSQASDVKDSSGSSLYYKNVINSSSEYIYWSAHCAGLTDAGSTITATNRLFVTENDIQFRVLSGGLDGGQPSDGDIQRGFDLFEDAESIDVNLLFSFPDSGDTATIGKDLISICEARKDCMAFISPPIAHTTRGSTPVSAVKTYATALGSTSYASLDSGAVYVYDKYNDEYMWIGSAGLIAGLCANTDSVADTWFSPAGVNRGQLRGVTKLAFNPNKAQRDELYKARINPLVSFPGQGTMLFGDKTLLSRPSAFDRINVRRLFIVLEKAISTAAKAQLFEFNDEFTQAQFRNMIEPFLRDVKGRRGMTDFLVICDDTNNTGQVVDSNRFVADIFIKPSRSINFITLNFIATRTGVDFSEVAGG